MPLTKALSFIRVYPCSSVARLCGKTTLGLRRQIGRAVRYFRENHAKKPLNKNFLPFFNFFSPPRFPERASPRAFPKIHSIPQKRGGFFIKPLDSTALHGFKRPGDLLWLLGLPPPQFHRFSSVFCIRDFPAIPGRSEKWPLTKKLRFLGLTQTGCRDIFSL